MQRSYEAIRCSHLCWGWADLPESWLISHTHTPSIHCCGYYRLAEGAGGAGLVQTSSRCSRASAICHQLQHLQIQGALDARCHCGPLRISAWGRVGREAAPRALITSSSLIIMVWLLLIFIILAVLLQDCFPAYFPISHIGWLTPHHPPLFSWNIFVTCKASKTKAIVAWN